MNIILENENGEFTNRSALMIVKLVPVETQQLKVALMEVYDDDCDFKHYLLFVQ